MGTPTSGPSIERDSAQQHTLVRSVSFCAPRHYARQIVALIALCCITLFLNSPAAAEQTSQFPEHIEVNGAPLLLNGTGLRKATIFGIRVYEGALYLAQRTRNSEEILSSTDTRQIHLHFLRDVTRAQLAEAFEDGAQKNAALTETGKSALHQFTESMRDVSKGDLLVFTFTTAAVHCTLNGQMLIEVQSAELSRALLSVWLGKYPPNEELKSGLLGL